MNAGDRLDYRALADACALTSDGWEVFAGSTLTDAWIAAYKAVTAWPTEIVEIPQESVVYLFDAAPTLNPTEGIPGDDRVVAVWGRSRRTERPRDRRRLAGFLPSPVAWSQADLDRGHLVAHAAGGGLDLNIFPQARSLNRGWSAEGRAWRRMEKYAAKHPGTPLFIRPIYTGPSWKPAAIEYGLFIDGELSSERFTNTP